jgi:8-amino-7-oxononanoate synthase
MANIGLIQALARPGDWLICDELNHASLIDAARLSRAQVRVFPHNDGAAVERLLDQAPADVRRIILVDGVFSMDGDVAPLGRLSALALEHEAWLVVDDAHGTGVVGPDGRGACAEADVSGDHVIQMVTLSKSLGSQGGAVVASRQVIQTVMNRARSFIFETALAPPAVAAARAALQIIRTEPDRRYRLIERCLSLRQGLADLGYELPGAHSIPIFPIIVGENRLALRFAEELRTHGFWVTPIRPPTVPEGSARLRVTLMCDHTEGDVTAFLATLGQITSARSPLSNKRS